ncbi:MAG: hypothetical protein Q9214_005432 [Letrouitia sp. 1 TL-2023]
MTTTPEPGRGQSVEPDSASSTSPSLETKSSIDSSLSIWRKTLNFITYTPKRCRYDPSNPPSFSLPLNLLFAFAGTFTVANLYYNHPILDILAHEFNVTGERASLIPTLAQTGYATGLLFLCPLGDVLPRRAYVLSLILFTATVWLGLCLTHNFNVFCFLTFLTSLTTVTPQLSMPYLPKGGIQEVEN